MIKRSRPPKGHLLIGIGLPSKRKKRTKTRKPCSFPKLHSSEKETGNYSCHIWIELPYQKPYSYDCTLVVMLEWFVSSAVVKKCLTSDELIIEKCVECRPEIVLNSCLYENVDIF